MSIKNIDKDNFINEVIKSNVPVLVDFWAAWCAPCRAVAPILEELASKHGGKLRVVKVNIDENPELASAYGIRSIPAFKVFNAGSIELEFGGALPKSQFIKHLDKYLL
ncbi:TPA: thioredoxin [Citrobacter koseri]|nr:thioredoxin [Citrobacter koseri]HEM7934616.1 thioredoxin [Citrobacter koseri]